MKCYINFVCVLVNFLPPFLPFLLFFSLCFLPYIFASLLVYFFTYLSTPSRIDPFCFQAGGRRRRPNPGFVLIMLQYIWLQLHVCFCCVCFSFSVLEISGEERLQNDLLCVGVGLKTLTQSIIVCLLYFNTFGCVLVKSRHLSTVQNNTEAVSGPSGSLGSFPIFQSEIEIGKQWQLLNRGTILKLCKRIERQL